MVYKVPDTTIPDVVKERDGEYEYECETFGKIPVCPLDVGNKDRTLFFAITDLEMARENLRRAEKHWRDYGVLPDKGQFPYVSYNGTHEKKGILEFSPQIYVPQGFDSDRITER